MSSVKRKTFNVISQRLTARNKFNFKLLKISLTVFILFNSYIMSVAQNISATLDREKILIGEQVVLQLQLNQLNSDAKFIDSWYQLKDTFNHIEVTKREPIDTISTNGLTSYTQKIILTSFDTGVWQISSLAITIQNKSTNKKTTLKNASLSLEVLSVDVSTLKDFHPIKEIIDVNNKSNLLLVIAITASALILIFTLYRIFKTKNKSRPKAEKYVSKGTALERAINKLQHLEEERLPEKQQLKTFHTKMDIIYREYFEESLAINALESTSDELLIKVNVYLQDAQLRSQFHELIRLNDAVKYAKYLPAEEQSKTALQATINTLRQIDAIIQKSLRHAH